MDLRIMSNQPEAAKLTALRARTDRQLVTLINNQLDRGFEADFVTAQRIYREVSQLLPVAYGASQADRRRLEAKLASLAETLNLCAFVA
jgi:hypothetical protein